MKKLLSIIIVTTIITLSWYQVSSADTIDECKIKDLNTYLTTTARSDFQKALVDEKDANDLDVRIAFEKARTKYHDTVKCVFDIATIKLLGSAAGIGKSVKADDLPDLNQKVLSELNKPDKVCALIEQGTLKDIINQDGPANLVEIMLKSYEYYSAFIRYLIVQQQNYPSIDSSFLGFQEVAEHTNALNLIMENEIQDSIVALDTAFLALKELRLSFVMHVHFQCMMKNLEVYRKMLGNLRTLVMGVPGLIEDASMHK